MEIRNVIQRRIRRRLDHGTLAADVNTAVAANVGDGNRSSITHVSSNQDVRPQKATERKEG